MVMGAMMVIQTVASIVFQVLQTKKKEGQQASQKSSDAKKGFEIVVEGHADYVPKIYGRAKIGGTRVFHGTSSDYKFVTTNADASFQTGTTTVDSGTYSRKQYDINGNLYNEVTTYSALDNGSLSKSYTGNAKNEFLYFQQVLCQGPINNVIEVIIDESRHLDDPALSDYVIRNESEWSSSDGGTETRVAWNKTKAALRINIFKSGGVADSIIAANFNERKDATFNNMAYVSGIVRLDMEDPQFAGVPSLQFLIEGALVRKVVGGILSTTYTYSNNPAWCLLDYLLDTKCGKGVDPLIEVDLSSFEASAAVCEMIVQNNVVVGGKMYQPTDNSRNVYTRNLPLYECNVITDPKKSIRDNIEAILETMGDARLIWSGGKYKLNLQYVNTNSALVTSTTITDDDLALDQSVSISWPTASQRLNYCTVRFHNECEEFKEDSVSWPSKVNSTINRGIGGFKYSHAITAYDENTVRGSLLNAYGVWSGTNVTTLDYKMLVAKSQAGPVTLTFAGDKSITITITDDSTSAVIYTGTETASIGTKALTMGNVSVDKVYSIRITGTAGSQAKAVSAKIETSSTLLWTTRSTAYTAYTSNVYTSTAYDAMLVEDSDIKLEFDMFSEGIVDAYHALAKAEELVRTSRSAFTMLFKYIVRSSYLEPGDYIKLQSDTLYLGSVANPLYLKVEAVKITEDSSCEITATRFDYTQLAWSVKDDQYVLPKPIYDSNVVAPAWIEYTPLAGVITSSSGTLNWAATNFVDQYILYMHTSDDLIDVNGIPVFSEIGRAPKGVTTFTLPSLHAASAYFGVKASVNGRLSKMTYTDTATAIIIANISYSFDDNLIFTYNSPAANQITWSAFTVTLNGTVVKHVSTGHATWTSNTLYLYYDPIKNGVFGTTSVNAAQSGKIIATYAGGTNLTPKVSGLLPPVKLYVYGTVGGVYTSKDLELVWSYPVANESSTSSLAKYQIHFIDTATNVVKYAEDVEYTKERGGYYKLFYANNVLYFGSATRSFTVKVYSVDTSGSLSSAATLVVNNSVPAAALFTATAGFDQAFIKIIPTTEFDIDGYYVYKSATTPVVKNATTLVYAGKDTNIVLASTAGIQYYYTVAAYDTFGKTGLLYGSEDTATAVSAEPDTYTYTGLVFKPGYSTLTTVTTNAVYWPSFVANKNGSTAVTVTSGTTTWATGTLYLYYIPGNTSMQWSTSLLTAISAGGRVLATYKGGTDLTSDQGKAFISGDQLLAGTVGANALVTNAAVITGSAQIGNVLQSTNYNWAAGNYTGWKIDKTGYAQLTSVEIRGIDGDVVFSTGTGMEWSYISGDGKPANNATRNVFKGDWALTTLYSSGDIVLDPLGYGWSCVATHTSSAIISYPTYPITESDLANNYWTLYAVKGVDAVSVILSNDTHTLPAASDGTVTPITAYVGSGTTVRVFDGTREVIYDAVGTSNGTWKVVATVDNIAVGTLTDSGDFLTVGNHSGVAAGKDTSSISYAITGKTFNGSPISITAQQSFSKSKGGVSGTPATYVTVTGEQAFKFTTGSATPTSSSITLTAALSGGLTAYRWDYWNGTGWTILSGTVNTSTYALAYNNDAFTTNSLRVRCISGTAFDELTIVKLYDGATGVSARSGYLTNETVAVPTASDGTGAVYTSAGGTFKVFNGTTDVTTSCAFSTSAAISGLTLTIGAATGIYSLAGTWTSDTASFTLTAVYSGTTITKVYTITKAKAGAAGTPGAAGDSVDVIFKRGANATTAPTITSPSTLAAAVAAGWSSSVPAAGVNPMWSSTGFQTASTGNYTWQAPVRIEGANVAEVTIYTRTASPTVPANTSGATYTFGTTSPLALVGVTVWSVAIPSGTLPVYTSRAVVSAAAGYTSAVGITGWTTPVISLQNGAAGAPGAQGPSVVVTPSRTASFTATDGTLDATQADIIFTAAVSGVTSPTYVWTFSGFQTAPTNSGVEKQTITQAQFGTSKSAIVTCTVSGTYVDKITVVRLEKTTAAAGATVGATIGTNLGGQITSANVSTFIKAGAIGAAQIRSINLTGNFNVASATTGQRMTMDSTVIKVYDAAGVLRVKLGNLI
jgi:hypothetical protein